jgi:hypothetical protein
VHIFHLFTEGHAGHFAIGKHDSARSARGHTSVIQQNQNLGRRLARLAAVQNHLGSLTRGPSKNRLVFGCRRHAHSSNPEPDRTEGGLGRFGWLVGFVALVAGPASLIAAGLTDSVGPGSICGGRGCLACASRPRQSPLARIIYWACKVDAREGRSACAVPSLTRGSSPVVLRRLMMIGTGLAASSRLFFWVKETTRRRLAFTVLDFFYSDLFVVDAYEMPNLAPLHRGR